MEKLQQIKTLVSTTQKSNQKQREFILNLIKESGYKLVATDDMGNKIRLTKKSKYVKIYKNNQKIGSLSFCDDGHISMFRVEEQEKPSVDAQNKFVIETENYSTEFVIPNNVSWSESKLISHLMNHEDFKKEKILNIYDGRSYHICQYCGQVTKGSDEDLLCDDCVSLFGHSVYSEL